MLLHKLNCNVKLKIFTKVISGRKIPCKGVSVLPKANLWRSAHQRPRQLLLLVVKGTSRTFNVFSSSS